MMGVFELIPGLGLCGGQFLLDSSVYFGRVFIVSQACVGYDETGTRFSLNLCAPGAPLGRALKVTAVFCSKNARASGLSDMWEGRAITKNTRLSWVTPRQSSY